MCFRQVTVVIDSKHLVGGMQTKLVESMAMRKAILATTWSNEGIDAVHGRELFIGDTPERFAEYVIELLSTPGLRREMGERAAEYVKRFSWTRATERMEEVEQEIALKKFSSV